MSEIKNGTESETTRSTLLFNCFQYKGDSLVCQYKNSYLQGADKISVNSAAINRPQLISEAAEKFGSQCVVVAIDAKRRADGTGWNIYKNGGRVDMGIDAIEWAKKVEEEAVFLVNYHFRNSFHNRSK